MNLGFTVRIFKEEGTVIAHVPELDVSSCGDTEAEARRNIGDQSKVSPDWKDAVLHARISLGGTDLMGADIPSAEPMRSAYLSLGVESDAEAERIFSALSDGGQVFMPMQETFFATRFGQLRDRFGINWMIIHER